MFCSCKETKFNYICSPVGRMAERLGTALQKLPQRFESAFDLKNTPLINFGGVFCFS
jgi:hypothetical protein